MNEQYIVLKDDVIRTFNDYVNSRMAFYSSDRDLGLMNDMNYKLIEWKNALSAFESFNPKANI